MAQEIPLKSVHLRFFINPLILLSKMGSTKNCCICSVMIMWDDKIPNVINVQHMQSSANESADRSNSFADDDYIATLLSGGRPFFAKRTWLRPASLSLQALN